MYTCVPVNKDLKGYLIMSDSFFRTRTNYVHVTDAKKFRKICGLCRGECGKPLTIITKKMTLVTTPMVFMLIVTLKVILLMLTENLLMMRLFLILFWTITTTMLCLLKTCSSSVLLNADKH